MKALHFVYPNANNTLPFNDFRYVLFFYMYNTIFNLYFLNAVFYISKNLEKNVSNYQFPQILSSTKCFDIDDNKNIRMISEISC